MKALATGLVIGVIATSLLSFVTLDAIADRDDKPKKGSNGQCRKLQGQLPEELQDYEGCHDSFTGKDHNDDGEPLP
jgi:hypothetical protein